MWVVNAPNDPDIKMAEGDYGIILPIKLTGATFAAADSVSIVIKASFNDDDDILTKTYTNIQENTVPFELSAVDTAKLPIGQYVYRMDWYQNGNFMCNIIPRGCLKVVDKV